MISAPDLFNIPDRLTEGVSVEWQWRVRNEDYLCRLIYNYRLGTYELVRRCEPHMAYVEVGDYHIPGWVVAYRIAARTFNIDRLIEWMKKHDIWARGPNKAAAIKKHVQTKAAEAHNAPARTMQNLEDTTREVMTDAIKGRGLITDRKTNTPKAR